MPNKKMNNKKRGAAKESPSKAASSATSATKQVTDDCVWKNPNSNLAKSRKVKLFPRPRRGQPPSMELNAVKEGESGTVDEIGSAALGIVHNTMVSMEVSFQKDVAKLHQLYHQVHFKPLQNLRGSLLSSISNPEQFRPTINEIKEKIRKTSMDMSTTSYDRLLRNCHLLVYAGPQLKANKFGANFWQKVLLNGDPLMRKIIKKDDDLLPFIEDISCDALFNSPGEEKETGFQISFKFARSNPCFYNTRIVKRYLIDVYPREKAAFLRTQKGAHSEALKDGEMLSYDGPRLIQICGTTINWKEGKNPSLVTPKPHSLREYLNFSWSELGNTDNKKAEIEYLVATYMRDNMIPNAYGIYLDCVDKAATGSQKSAESEQPDLDSQAACSMTDEATTSDACMPCTSRIAEALHNVRGCPAFRPKCNYNTVSLLNVIETLSTTTLRAMEAADAADRGRGLKRRGEKIPDLHPSKSARLGALTKRTVDHDESSLPTSQRSMVNNWKVPNPSCGVWTCPSWVSIDDDDCSSTSVSSVSGSAVAKQQLLKGIKDKVKVYKRAYMKKKSFRRRILIPRIQAAKRRALLPRMVLAATRGRGVPSTSRAGQRVMSAALRDIRKRQQKRLYNAKQHLLQRRNRLNARRMRYDARRCGPMASSVKEAEMEGASTSVITKSNPRVMSAWRITRRIQKQRNRKARQRFRQRRDFTMKAPKIKARVSKTSLPGPTASTSAKTESKSVKRDESWTTVSECVIKRLQTSGSWLSKKLPPQKLGASKSATAHRIHVLPFVERTKRSDSVHEISEVLWKDFLATNCRLSGKDERLYHLLRVGKEERTVRPVNDQQPLSNQQHVQVQQHQVQQHQVQQHQVQQHQVPQHFNVQQPLLVQQPLFVQNIPAALEALPLKRTSSRKRKLDTSATGDDATPKKQQDTEGRRSSNGSVPAAGGMFRRIRSFIKLYYNNR